MGEREVTVVKTGTWLYDGQVEKPVRILRQTWDTYYEDGYDDDPPDLNEEGFAYYAVYDEPWAPEPGQEDREPRWFSRSRTCLSLEEAVALAEKAAGSPITWGALPEIEDLDRYIHDILKKAGRHPYPVFQIIEIWEGFIDDCEGGYGFDFSEYNYELGIRDTIAVLATDPALQRNAGFRWFLDRLPALDARFKALLREDVAIKGDDAPWWHRGVLACAGADYAGYIKSAYGIEVEVRRS